MKLKHRNVICILLAGMLVFSFGEGAFAGITGKLAGRVVDSATGEPLAGANVFLEGTALGAASDLNGYYVILNIPPGIYSLRGTMMGYKQVNVEMVRIKIDLTTTIDFNLNPTVLDATESVTVVAERNMVQMDMTGSMSSVGAGDIESMPVQSVSDVLELEAGLVRDGGGFHIRGGRTGEVAYWVDGVAATDFYGGGMGVEVENSAIEEIQVVSGTFNAEYGQAMSGIINIVTKEGGREFSGQLKGYAGDYVSDHDVYSVLDEVEYGMDAETGLPVILKETSSNPLMDFNPAYNLEGSLSGPIPGLRDKLTFFTNARYFSNEGYVYGRDWFKPQGIAGDSSLVALDPYEKMSAQAKLTWKLNSNMKFSYSLFWDEWNKDRGLDRHEYKYVPDALSQRKGGGLTHHFSFNHMLSPTTFYEVRINRMTTDYEQYVYEDATLRPNYLVQISADSLTGSPELVLDLSTEEGQAALNDAQIAGTPYDFLIDPTQSEGYVHSDSARAPAGYSFWRAGMNMNHLYRSTSYWVGKVDITSQVNKAHQIKAGFEARAHELKRDFFTIQPATVPGMEEQIVPFVPEIPEVSSIRHDKYTRNPREFSAYLQDKLELSDLIMNIGVRFDYFDANSVVPVDMEDPNIYDPFKPENIWKNPEAPEAERIEYTPEERRAFMHKDVDAKMQLSPRLGMAYPITDKGVIHFSYGHFFQIPEFQYLYQSPDFKLFSGGGLRVIGNADLNVQKTVQYEIGMQQEIMPNVGIDVTVFYRDIRDWVGTSPLINTAKSTVKYSIYENKDYSNVRGFTVKLDRRYANGFSAGADYSFSVAEGTYSNPTDAFNAINNEEEPRLSLIPLNWDQRHTLSGVFTFNAQDWVISLKSQYRTGRPYTPSYARGSVVGGSNQVGWSSNSQRRPNIVETDLYVNRKFDMGAYNLNLFLTVYNLLDSKGETGVYSDTGTARYSTSLDPAFVGYSDKRIGTVEDLTRRPTWYIAPRQIQAGLSIEF